MQRLSFWSQRSRRAATAATAISALVLICVAAVTAQPRGGGFGPGGAPAGGAPGAGPRGGGFGGPRFGDPGSALEAPFVGLTTDGTPVSDLFEIETTGVATAPVRAAAERFIAALDAEQREQVAFAVDDTEWRNWANIHRFAREGVSVADMSEAQRAAAYDLLRASLSARGYETARDIMRLNHHLAELVDNFDEYGEHLYWFSLMGTPSAEEPWGWQLDGHHLVVNYFVLGDQIVMTPTFMGSEPVRAESGQYAGTEVLQAEQRLALELMQALDTEQRRDAIVSATKSRGENRAEMMSDNVVVAPEGLPATRLNAAQRDRLLALVESYVGNMDAGHAAVRMDEIRAHLDATTFAWKGSVEPDGVFYYRVQSPVVYIEFDHQGPVALDGPRNEATRRHIHTVMRTPNGNDYGKDLLRQHYEAYRDDPTHGHRAAAAAGP
jgi:hypothetical protein